MDYFNRQTFDTPTMRPSGGDGARYSCLKKFHKVFNMSYLDIPIR